MKLTAKVHLQPTPEQAELLLQTMQEANAACDRISAWAWENKVFARFKIHHGVYHDIKGVTELSAQVVVQCIAKVTNAYKLDRKKQRRFRPLGAITYDNRILSYKFDKRIASVWTVADRQKMPYLTGEHHAQLLKHAQGEADLAYVKGKFYLLQTCDIPHEVEQEFDDVVGVDLGINQIAATDDGETFAGKALNELRAHRQRVRGSLQSKGTKGAKRVLKRLSGKERTTVKITNHTIAKQIVAKAKQEQKGIAVEDLKGIRDSTNKRRVHAGPRVHGGPGGGLRRSQRGLHNRWSFHVLQGYISYKAQRVGIPVYFVPSPYTSKTCSCCKKIGKRNGEKFSCEACGSSHADVNAAKNIRELGMSVIHPENSTMCCSYGGLHVC